MLSTALIGELLHCVGFQVESPSGPVGFVEEVWLGPEDEPTALALRTVEGRRGLLLADEVSTVVSEYQWVVIRPEATLLELEPPRLSGAPETTAPHLTAQWATTGTSLPVRQRVKPRRLALRLWRRAPKAMPATPPPEQPIWRTIAVLYGALALTVGLIIAIAFVIAQLVAGRAY